MVDIDFNVPVTTIHYCSVVMLRINVSIATYCVIQVLLAHGLYSSYVFFGALAWTMNNDYDKDENTRTSFTNKL